MYYIKYSLVYNIERAEHQNRYGLEVSHFVYNNIYILNIPKWPKYLPW